MDFKRISERFQGEIPGEIHDELLGCINEVTPWENLWVVLGGITHVITWKGKTGKHPQRISVGISEGTPGGIPKQMYRRIPEGILGFPWSSSYRHSCKTWVFSITHTKGGRYDSRSMQEPFVMKNSLTSLGIEHLRACHMIYTHMQNAHWRRKLTVNNCTGWVRLKYIDFGMLTFSVLGKSKRLVLLFPTFRPFYLDFFKGLTVNRSSLHKVLPDFWEGASCIQFCTLILQFWDTGT